MNAFRKAAVLVLMTLVAYLPAVSNGYIWDDDAHLTENRAVLAPDGLVKIWADPSATAQYYPVVFSAFWLQHRLWGLQPFGYHLVNILLHALNAVLAWLILRRLSLPGAWFAAAVFALHPVHVESVAWVSELKNVLSGAWYFAAMLAYLRFAGVGEGAQTRWVRAGRVASPGRWYALSLGLFLAAVLSKTVTCSLPVVLALLLWWKRGRLLKADVIRLLPMLVIGLGMGLLTISLEARHLVSEDGEAWSFSGLDRVLIAGRALWFYAGKLLWPHPLLFMYPRWQIDAAVWWQWLYPAGAVMAILAAWMFRARLGRGLLTTMLVFAGTLLPALGFFNVYPFRYSFVADHFQYLASLSLIAAFAAASACRGTPEIPQLTGLSKTRSAAANVRFCAGALLLLALGGLTWRQAAIYKDRETLWLSVLERNPASWMAHNNLGIIRYKQGKDGEAAGYFTEAIRLNPAHARAHNNLGAILQKQGKLEDAIAHYLEAIRAVPRYHDAYNSLGTALVRQGKLEEAEERYRQALQLRPDFPEAHYNYGLLLTNLDRHAEAIAHYQEAIRFRPGYAKAHLSLAILLERTGEPAAARRHRAIAERLAGSEQAP